MTRVHKKRDIGPSGTNAYWNERTKLPDVREQRRIRARRNKVQVIALLGGSCEICGDALTEHMTIDHPQGNGREHRRKYGAAQRILYRIRRREEDTLDLRLLCYSCNCSLGHHGYSPIEAMRVLYAAG